MPSICRLKLVLLLFLAPLLFSCNKSKQLDFNGNVDFNLKNSLKLCELEDKKLLIYFNSFGCAGCRTMEENILNDENIKNLLNDHFDFYILYTDDKRKINNANEVVNYQGNFIQYNGELNSYYQRKLTNSSIQPLFVVVENDSLVKDSYSYTTDKLAFLNFLNKNK